jgi:hypothetical protein
MLDGQIAPPPQTRDRPLAVAAPQIGAVERALLDLQRCKRGARCLRRLLVIPVSFSPYLTDASENVEDFRNFRVLLRDRNMLPCRHDTVPRILVRGSRLRAMR